MLNVVRCPPRLSVSQATLITAGLCLSAAASLLFRPQPLSVQGQPVVWSNQEKPRVFANWLMR
jgi:hypothetical protein